MVVTAARTASALIGHRLTAVVAEYSSVVLREALDDASQLREWARAAFACAWSYDHSRHRIQRAVSLFARSVPTLR